MAIDINEVRLEPQDVTFGTHNLGSVSDVSLNMSTETVTITAGQFGNQTLGERLIAFQVSVSLVLNELSLLNWQKLVGDVSGGKVDLTASGGDVITGVGTAKLFSAIEAYADKLVLKPSNSGADNTRNITLHKAYPKIGSVSYSGTEIATMEVEFIGVRDATITDEVNIMALGTWTPGDLDA